MKRKIIFLGLSLLLFDVAQAQQAPTGSPVPNGYTTPQQAASAWYRGGNYLANTGWNNNLLGTAWNSPIYFITGGSTSPFYRMKMNGIFDGPSQYNINGYGAADLNTTGYILIGKNNSSITDNKSLYQDKGAFSQLHINGEGSSYQEYGYRPWMKTGITLTGNRDLSYFGLRKLGSGEDITETTIAWSDNTESWHPGPDEMVFRFISGQASQSYLTDFSGNNDMDGLHVARFTGAGRMGLGNTFGINMGSSVGYNTPQSLMHMSYQFRSGTQYQPYGYMQVTYRRPNGAVTDIIGQGELATDGLRFGIDNTINGNGTMSHLNGYLRWQEASSFIIQTEDNISPNIAGNERIRITSTGALKLNYETNYIGIKDPTNTTRVSISQSGSNPVKKPLSLLHLGYDYGGNLFGLLLPRGYRTWMDLGTLTSTNEDHLWIGLKPRVASPYAVSGSNNGMDAVLAWGNNSHGPTNADSDVMRFIFTSDPVLSPNESPQSKSQEGLEVMRLYAHTDTTTQLGGKVYGRVGVGDFTIQGVNEQPTHKLDVIGNGRFRYLPDSLYISDSTVTKYVMVDSLGVLRWTTTPISSFGVPCSDTVNGLLSEDRKIHLNEHNFYFEDDVDGSLNNNVGFGWECGMILKAKVDAIQTGIGGIAGSFLTVKNDGLSATGARGMTSGDGQGTGLYYGLVGSSGGVNSVSNYGVYGNCTLGLNNYAGYFNGAVHVDGVFTSSDSILKKNVNKINSSLELVKKLRPVSYYFKTSEFSQFNLSQSKQYGFLAQEVAMILPELVQSAIQPGKLEDDGSFTGETTEFLSINYTGLIPFNTAAIIELNQKVDRTTLADETVKTNVTDLDGSLKKVIAMRGVSYDWDQSNHQELQLDSESHLGFIAQEMQLIDRRLTYLDEDSLLHIEYDKITPILAEAIGELHNHVESQDSIISAQKNQIDDLNNRLSSLEKCLSGILPFLCQMSNSTIEQNEAETQEQLRSIIDVQLSNRNSIVLNQNVPNPFAESTVITYTVPATVQRAQIHFYDMQGTLINSVEITERGEGQLNVYGNDLSSGIYTYSLVADGTVVSTKKMMKN